MRTRSICLTMRFFVRFFFIGSLLLLTSCLFLIPYLVLLTSWFFVIPLLRGSCLLTSLPHDSLWYLTSWVLPPYLLTSWFFVIPYFVALCYFLPHGSLWDFVCDWERICEISLYIDESWRKVWPSEVAKLRSRSPPVRCSWNDKGNQSRYMIILSLPSPMSFHSFLLAYTRNSSSFWNLFGWQKHN